jgi:hypothetical protein
MATKLLCTAVADDAGAHLKECGHLEECGSAECAYRDPLDGDWQRRPRGRLTDRLRAPTWYETRQVWTAPKVAAEIAATQSRTDVSDVTEFMLTEIEVGPDRATWQSFLLVRAGVPTMPASASFLRAVFPSAVNVASDSIGPPLALQKPAVYTWEAGRARQLLAQLWETMAVTFAFFFSHVEGSDDAAGDDADKEGPRPPSPSIFSPDALLPRPSENPFFSAHQVGEAIPRTNVFHENATRWRHRLIQWTQVEEEGRPTITVMSANALATSHIFDATEVRSERTTGVDFIGILRSSVKQFVESVTQPCDERRFYLVARSKGGKASGSGRKCHK